MKKLLTIAILAAAMFRADAQTFGTGTVITGTNFALSQSSLGVPLTNSVYFYVPPKTVYLTGITSTNETITGWYGVQHPGAWALMPGTSNVYIIGTFTNSFAAGTNGGTWTTNFPTLSATAVFPCWMGINIGNFTNTITVFP